MDVVLVQNFVARSPFATSFNQSGVYDADTARNVALVQSGLKLQCAVFVFVFF
jgi:hypothetical protein